MAKAAALREKEAAACAKEKTEYAANSAALGKAIAAIESGRAGSFIQTPAAKLLVRYAAVEADLPECPGEKHMTGIVMRNRIMRKKIRRRRIMRSMSLRQIM